jgi:cytochrome b6-f complex iron-sulfur subunit/menaquinol-cytochrome c reductase iron-sulfur subunit
MAAGDSGRAGPERARGGEERVVGEGSPARGGGVRAGARASAGHEPPPPGGRRALVGGLCAALGLGIAAVWAVPGARFLAEPLARRNGHGGGRAEPGRWRRVARLDDVPTDAAVAVTVVGPRVDAWTRTPAERLGTVLLRRKSDREVVAFQAECPHLGCSVRVDAERRRFACPCHESYFDLDGKQTSGPSPRDLDPLATRVTEDGYVEVEFVRYRTQTSERVRLG